jgi:hypothetical protein
MLTEIEVVRVPLTQGQFTIIEAADAEFVKQWDWIAVNIRGRWYAARKQGGKTIYLHVALMKTPKGFHTDHRDRDSLNNCRSNLRIVTVSQNQQNAGVRSNAKSSQYKGVSWSKRRQMWRAQIGLKGRNQSIGHYPTEDEAALAYNAKAIELFGEFAKPNLVVKVGV